MLLKTDPRNRAWIEIDPKSIEQNARIIRNLLAEDCLLMAVVKADGYGHGAETVARAALLGGAHNLGVATLQEGLDLRAVGIDCPILVLGNLIQVEELRACLGCDLMPTISSYKEALLCQKIAEDADQYFEIHLKVDTGMTRLGCDFEESFDVIKSILTLTNLKLKGIYSHLALADGDINGESAFITEKQKQRFEELLTTLPSNGKDFCRHLANSAGAIRDPGLHFDMVRVGLALYGYNPISHLHKDLGLSPALSVKARVTLLREVPAGVGVSYGHQFTTNRKSRLAVVAIGYADGVSRALSGRISVLFNEMRLPQVGSITMDQLVIDVTNYPEIEVGSIVTLLGKDGNTVISPQEWSGLIGSIPWEVLCGFKNRLPRLIA